MKMEQLLNPAVPAGAYDDLLARALPEARIQRVWEPADGPLPALFVSHGAPFTFDHPGWLQDFFAWGQSLPKPRGIVVVSAHWEDAPLAMSSTAEGAPLFYDFGGFHPRYYTLQYQTPDATALAHRVAGALADTTPIHRFTDRGLDHGAFIPLMAMFPAADVPVIQVSMPSLAPEELLDLGTRLKELRREGVLVVGSGFMTHTAAAMRDPAIMSVLEEFDAWALDAFMRGDADALADFHNKGPAAAVCHPTDDHFVPLLVALGAADDPSRTVSGIDRFVVSNSARSLEVT
jgi:4,5-DOPA dioxygenase extradiol